MKHNYQCLRPLSELQRVRSIISPRQMDVWKGVARGLSSTKIGAELGLSPKTIDAHIEALKNKLSVESRQELIFAAIRYRVVEIDVLPEDAP